MKINDSRLFSKQTFLVLSTLVAFSSLAAACSSSTPADSSKDGTMTAKDDTKAPTKPTEIKIMADYTIAQPPGPDNPVLKEFEKRTNTKLTVQWIPGGDYADRVNVALAAGDIADLIKIPNITTPLFRQAGSILGFDALCQRLSKPDGHQPENVEQYQNRR
jgi:putative aldouronate transport system substrate-binding protein